jgi:hypothetical protein
VFYLCFLKTLVSAVNIELLNSKLYVFVGNAWNELGNEWSELGNEWSELGNEWSEFGNEWSEFGNEWNELGNEWSECAEAWNGLLRIILYIWGKIRYLVATINPIMGV